jgi:hypothetical protein
VIGRFIFWDFPRASWQYDVMVALILVFIFATPRELFRDQPRPATVQMIQPGTFWIEPRQLSNTPPDGLVEKAAQLVDTRFKPRTRVNHVEPMYDEESEIVGYIASSRP